MDNRLIRNLLIVGIVLDLIISGVLLYQQVQISNNQTISNCWSSVLDYAIKQMPKPHSSQVAYKIVLDNMAKECANLK